MDYSVTRNGKPLDESRYTIDFETKVFMTNESDLVLDFSLANNFSFKTGSNCTFSTGANCIFNTQIYSTIVCFYGCKITLVNNLNVILHKPGETKVFHTKDYYIEDLNGLQLEIEDLERLKDFPLDDPRLLMLHKNDDLGKLLFNHYRKKGLL